MAQDWILDLAVGKMFVGPLRVELLGESVGENNDSGNLAQELEFETTNSPAVYYSYLSLLTYSLCRHWRQRSIY